MPANKHLPSVQAMFVGVAHSYAALCAIWAQFAIYRPTQLLHVTYPRAVG